jgi:hypothetical protein
VSFQYSKEAYNYSITLSKKFDIVVRHASLDEEKLLDEKTGSKKTNDTVSLRKKIVYKKYLFLKTLYTGVTTIGKILHKYFI